MKTELVYRQLTAFIFLAAFLAQTFSWTFTIADYYSNTRKYAQNCENKATPLMHCNGKCQMMKKLQQEEKQEQENPDRKSDNKSQIILSTKSFIVTIPTQSLIQSKLKKILPFCDSKSIDRSLDIFHPPQV